MITLMFAGLGSQSEAKEINKEKKRRIIDGIYRRLENYELRKENYYDYAFPYETNLEEMFKKIGYQYEENEERNKGRQLAENLESHLRDLREFQNLEIIKNSRKILSDRYEDASYFTQDIGFQQYTKALVERGIINKHSLVVSLTGHNIPIYAIGNLVPNMQSIFRFDGCAKLKGNYQRIISQADTWDDEISKINERNYDDYIEEHENEGVAVFLGLDLHSKDGYDIQELPDIDLLIEKYKCNNIVILVEEEPGIFKYHEENMQLILENMPKGNHVIEYINDFAKEIGIDNTYLYGTDWRQWP